MDQRIFDAAIRQWRTRLRIHALKPKADTVSLFKSCSIKTKGSRNYDSPCIFRPLWGAAA